MRSARKQQYDTHFYCALCGGPFAHVFRTPLNPATTTHNTTDDDDNKNANGYDDSTNTDPENEFNYSSEENRIIPEEVVQEDMSYAAKRSRRLRLEAQQHGKRKGMMPEPRTVRQAYDGQRISVDQMKWTRNLRAIINRKAREHPLNYELYLDQDSLAYMTGRGLIRQGYNWADAYASIEEDEDVDDDNNDDNEARVHPEYPVFSDSARMNNTYGFHVYKEFNAHHTSSFISSIPFHDECWTLLDLAVEETGNELGLENMNEALSMDTIWGHLRSLITVSGDKQEGPGSQSTRTLQPDHPRGVITRLGEVDYREAQSSGEGWHWKHEDGCHWLAADPSMISILDLPLKSLPCESPWPVPPRAALVDPFMTLPAEVILEVANYLPSADIFNWKIASPQVMSIGIPDSYYRRFLREDFGYLPSLAREVRSHEQRHRNGEPNEIDWRGSFERLHRLMRTPELSGDPEDEGYGKEWDQVDISLKNRRRIWNIVKPIAETLVHTSSQALVEIHGAVERIAERSAIVRGQSGIRSGQPGIVQTTYFGARAPVPEDWDTLEKFYPEITVVRMWTEAETGAFCGMRFFTADSQGRPSDLGIFGREGSSHSDIFLHGQRLAGIAACMANGIICGAQLFVFSHSSEEYETTLPKKKVGRWNGSVRKTIAPPFWRRLVGFTGFINSRGFIETIGLLEETVDANRSDERFESMTPPTMPLSHQEASIWKNGLPPVKVSLREREGPNIPEWRTFPAEWEIWAKEPNSKRVYCEDGLESIYHRSMPEEKTLHRIKGYFDESFLRGLEFVYVDDVKGTTVTRLIGTRDAPKTASIELIGQSVVAAVINHSEDGVHGILFVTDGEEVSEVFGPRFLGIHKVFAPLNTDEQTRMQMQKTIYREELPHGIIGLHALYDNHDKRFLQLGLVLPLEDGHTVFPTSYMRKIPFDEMSEDKLVWDNGPPPSHWIIGNSQMFSENEITYKATHGDRMFHDFTGWAPFAGLQRVTIYGNLQGIRFSYRPSTGRKDIYFGYVDNESDILVQDFARGEQVTGIAFLDRTPEVTTKGTQDEADWDSIVSATSRNEPVPLEKICLKFITNFNSTAEHRTKKHFESTDLCGLQFHFNFHHIVEWAPIYDPSKPGSSLEIQEHARYPWKKHSLDICADPAVKIPKHTDPVAISFASGSCGHIDGIKVYVDMYGKPCGLLLRRDGCWSKEVFGQRSAYESNFDLGEGETITSIFTPEVDGKLSFEALAFSTNWGNTSPWFGRTSGAPSHRTAPDGHAVIGLFAAYNDPIALTYDCVPWDVFGILYRPDPRGTRVSPPPAHVPPPSSCRGYNITDKHTNLQWLNNMQNHTPPGIKLSPMALKVNNYPSSSCLGKAWSLFDPAELRQVRIWPGGTGIKGIQFRGGPRMGTITVGEWPEGEDHGLPSGWKMCIDGPGGERIVRIPLAFQRVVAGDSAELRLIGMTVETTRKKSKTVVSQSLVPENPRSLSGDECQVLECPEGAEIWGLHGVFGRYNIHDLGLAIRYMDGAISPRIH